MLNIGCADQKSGPMVDAVYQKSLTREAMKRFQDFSQDQDDRRDVNPAEIGNEAVQGPQHGLG